MEPKLFVAGKAFIKNQEGKILILRESAKYKDSTNTGKYDVPGGRLKPGENLIETLKREIKEETGLEINVGRPFAVNEWKPLKNNEQWHIVAMFFECTLKDKEFQIKLSEDHDHYNWISPENFRDNNIIENLHKVFEAYPNK